jgi:predicted P-loop ATPase/GTPase
VVELSSYKVSKCNVRYKQTNKYVLFIDDVVKDVNNVFYEAANLSLKQKPLRKSTSKPKQNVK